MVNPWPPRFWRVTHGLADHVVAPQQLAWQGAGAGVLLEGHGAVDEGEAQARGLLDQAALPTREVRSEDRLGVDKPQLLQVVDDEVGPSPHAHGATVFEVGKPGGKGAHL